MAKRALQLTIAACTLVLLSPIALLFVLPPLLLAVGFVVPATLLVGAGLALEWALGAPRAKGVRRG